jgi:hypothetical protein
MLWYVCVLAHTYLYITYKIKMTSQALVTHACNPIYPGGRAQEDHISKPAWANTLQDPILKNRPSQKRAGGVAVGVAPDFKLQYSNRKKKKDKDYYS